MIKLRGRYDCDWRSALCLALGIFVYVYLHFATGSAVAPISDDFRQIEFTKSMDTWLDCFQVESFGMLRPVKSLLFYAAFKWGLGHVFFQYCGAVMAVLCCLLTWRVACRIFGTSAWACFAALLWLYLPLNVVVFNWASALNISVYYCFSMLAVLFAAQMSEFSHSRKKYLYLSLVLFAYVGALFSYEMALSLPFLLGLYLFVFSRKAPGLALSLVLGAGLVTITLFFFVIRSVILTGSTASISANSLIVESEPWLLSFVSSYSYLEHLRFLFWPYKGFEFLIPLDPAASMSVAGLGWIAIFAMVVLGLKMYGRFPYLLFALLWSAIALVTVLNFIPIGAGPLAEYYMPLAAFGWIVCLVALVRAFVVRYSMGGGGLSYVLAGLVPVLFFAAEVREREYGWRSEEALYEQVVESSERSHKVFALLAQIRLGQERAREAVELAEHAMAMSPENVDYVVLYLTCIKSFVPMQKMEILIATAMEAYPHASGLSVLEGDLLFTKNNHFEAQQAYEKAYSQALTKWDQASALNALGVYWAARGNYVEAKARFAQALRVKPYDAAVRANWLQACKDVSRAQVE